MKEPEGDGALRHLKSQLSEPQAGDVPPTTSAEKGDISQEPLRRSVPVTPFVAVGQPLKRLRIDQQGATRTQASASATPIEELPASVNTAQASPSGTPLLTQRWQPTAAYRRDNAKSDEEDDRRADEELKSPGHLAALSCCQRCQR
ncbi:MAG: hypothetical protein QOF39_1472 [Frankiales bacterium]|jgi:hypothetical protein|nr:hypothetical protein [Frankiales bacterium]